MVKKKAQLALLPLTLCLSSAPVLAATTADLERRLEQQEKKIKKLENRLKGTRSAVKENRSRISSAADRLKINGFFSAGAAMNDGDDMLLPERRIQDDYRTESVAKLGIQMTFEVAENMDLTAQLVTRGVDDYEISAEWAYLNWEVNNELDLRIGRQRIPYYLLSEYLDVGYAYPWVAPPIELYNLPTQQVDGLGANYAVNVGDWNLSVQAYAGQARAYTTLLESEFVTNQAWGGAFFAETGPWTFRLGYTQSNLEIASLDIGGDGYTLGLAIDGVNELAQTIEAASSGGLTALYGEVPQMAETHRGKNERTEYTSAAFMYDDGKLLVMGEIANLTLDQLAAPASDAGYLTVGYRFGKWMPHVTFSKYTTHSDSDDLMKEQINVLTDIQKAIFLGGFVPPGGSPLPGYAATFIGSGNASAAQAAGDAALEALYAATASQGLDLLGFQSVWQNFIKQQQSYTLGITYDINPRVKAKFDVTHTEDFGSYDVVGAYSGTFTPPNIIDATPLNVAKQRGTGRWVVDPGVKPDKHTAVYSFSIDAVF